MEYQTYPDQVRSVHNNRNGTSIGTQYVHTYLVTRNGNVLVPPGGDRDVSYDLDDFCRIDGPWEHQWDVKVKNVLYHFGRNYAGTFEKLCLQRNSIDRRHYDTSSDNHPPSHLSRDYSNVFSRVDGNGGFVSGYRLIVVGHGEQYDAGSTLTYGMLFPRASYNESYKGVGSWTFDFSRQMWVDQENFVLARSVTIEACKCCRIGERLTLNVIGPGWDGKIAYFDLFGWVFGIQDLPQYFEWERDPS